MKKEELRIGNYLRWKKDVHQEFDDGTKTKVADKHAVRKVSSNIDSSLEGKEAVPLTEDWLIKFGFEIEGKSNWFVFSNLCLNLNFKDDFNIGVENKRCVMVQDDESYFQLIFPEHIHQLQNLYHALTGEELKLND